jgi:transcriptional regulator with XRE-family HTH domain
MKITQTKLAQLTKLSQPYISQICHGERTPSWDTAKKLAGATGLDEKAWMDNDIELIFEVVQVNQTANI